MSSDAVAGSSVVEGIENKDAAAKKEVAAAENKVAAAKAEVAGAKAELAEAKERLVKAEDVLRKAEEGVPMDAQRVAKAEQHVAKAEQHVAEAKLGVAKAELGVAKAELGVAKAEWQAAPENEKAVFLAIDETANKAYDKALIALTATPQQGESSQPTKHCQASLDGIGADGGALFVVDVVCKASLWHGVFALCCPRFLEQGFCVRGLSFLCCACHFLCVRTGISGCAVCRRRVCFFVLFVHNMI